jgi:drug/metabolite transporter (DMT)-like permease
MRRSFTAGKGPARPNASGMAALTALAPLLWATNFVVGKVLLLALPPTTVTVARWAVATALVGPAFVGAVRRQGFDPRLPVMGLLGVAAFSTLLYSGLTRTTAVHAGIIYAATPAFALVGERLAYGAAWSWRRAAGLVATMVGVAAVVGAGGRQSWHPQAGDGLVLAAGICWAAYTVMGKGVLARFSPLEVTGGSGLLGVLWLLPWWGQALHAAWSPARLAGAAYLGVFPSVVANLLWLQGVRSLGPAATAVVGNLLPVFTAALAHWRLGEAVTATDWVGGLLTCGGVALAVWQPARAAEVSEHGA